MDWWQALLLGLLQGVTEFLPISSSGHLVLVQHWLGFPDATHPPGAALFLDGILHLGTAVAVLVYFRRAKPNPTLWPKSRGEVLRLAVLLVLAMLPAILAVSLAGEYIKESFERPLPVAGNFLILGIILCLSDGLPAGRTSGSQMRWWQALCIGLGQAASAIFRGLSRSGMTLSVSLLVGIERGWAVRFSFLLSIVASAGLGAFGILDALRDPAAGEWLTPEYVLASVLGAIVSGVVGYFTLGPLFQLVQRARLWWFSVYLWLVAAFVLIREL
jgi:undecaprenyl-diphosphatase